MSAIRFLESRSMQQTGGLPKLSYTTATAAASQPYNWKRDTNQLLNATEVQKTQSSKTRQSTNNAQDASARRQEETYADSNNALRNQINDATKIRQQLEDTLRRVEEEIAYAEYERKILNAEQNAMEEPLAISNECLKAREYRPPREKTRDNAERALVEQAAGCQNAINTLNSAHHANSSELERLVAVKQYLERDILDKSHALALDEQCLNMQPGQYPLAAVDFSAPGIDMALRGEGGAAHGRSGGLPYVWKQSTGALMDEAAKIVGTSRRVRAESENVRADAAALNADTRAKVSDSLRRKIDETMRLRSQLEHKLEQVVQEIGDVEHRRQAVERSLSGKMEPLATAQQRLAIRKQRPSREQVRDNVEMALEKEVAENRAAIAQLSSQNSVLMAEINRCQEAQHQLELDIQDKSEACAIDANCLDLQGRVPELMDEKLRLYQ